MECTKSLKCSPTASIETTQLSNSREALSLVGPFAIDKGNLTVLCFIHSIAASIDELRDWHFIQARFKCEYNGHLITVSCQVADFSFASWTHKFLSSNFCNELIKPFDLPSLSIATHRPSGEGELSTPLQESLFISASIDKQQRCNRRSYALLIQWPSIEAGPSFRSTINEVPSMLVLST